MSDLYRGEPPEAHVSMWHHAMDHYARHAATCVCGKRSGIIARPSGTIVCGDCGGLVVDPPPAKKDRP